MTTPALQRRRWLDRLTTGLLAASVGVTLGAATPALLRVAGVDVAEVGWVITGKVPHGPPGAEGSASPLVLPHRPPEILAHPDGLSDPTHPFDPDDDEGLLEEPRGQLGLARGPLVLHDQPAGAARVVGDVQAGEMVTILRIAGDWALVYYGGNAGLVLGWAKKSEIAIR